MPTIEYIKSRDWNEQATLIYQFHRDKQTEHGATSGKRGRPHRFERDAWTLKDTAKALNLSVGYISESINLAKYLSLHPDFKYVRDRITALRMMAGKEVIENIPTYLGYNNSEFLTYIADLLVKHKEKDEDVIIRLRKMAKEMINA